MDQLISMRVKVIHKIGEDTTVSIRFLSMFELGGKRL